MALPSERAHAPSAALPPRDPPAPLLALIFAVASDGTIGIDGTLPWRLPEDLKRFRALTTGHAVIMGRKTWDSLPRALPQRQNIVVTRDRSFAASGADVAHSLDAALDRVSLPPPVFCIGGAELYRLALPRADLLYFTEIAREFGGNVRLPALDPAQWREVAREPGRPEGPQGFDYAFVTYARVRP